MLCGDVLRKNPADISANEGLRGRNHFENALLWGILAVFAMKLYLAFVLEINWDEFLILSFVYDYARGDLTNVTPIYVHVFGWLAAISPNEVDQIVAARLVMFVLNAATAWFLYRVAREFFSRKAALIALLSYLSFSFSIRHGTSFRMDPVLTFLLMASLWLTLSGRFDIAGAILAGGLFGLAGLITIKAVFYAPIFAVLLVGRWLLTNNRYHESMRNLTMLAGGVISIGVIYAIHSETLTRIDPLVPFFAHAYASMIGAQGFFPQYYWFQVSIIQNITFWLILLSGIGFAAISVGRTDGSERTRWIMVLSFASVMPTLFFYVASYPYYYVFMLAPAVVLCAAAIDQITEPRRGQMLMIISALLMINALANYGMALGQDNAGQRDTLATIHQIFPTSDSYIDRCSMVSRYRKVGLFMASWEMNDYRDAGQPIMRAILQKEQPHFLLANSEYLDVARFSNIESDNLPTGLLPEDQKTLRDNFIPHWGILYVAGKQFNLGPIAPTQDFEILIRGTYTLESEGSVNIDGHAVAPDESIRLQEGVHSIDLIQTEGKFVLRWGETLFRPKMAPPTTPIFRGF
jgi:hypothetical protein